MSTAHKTDRNSRVFSRPADNGAGMDFMHFKDQGSLFIARLESGFVTFLPLPISKETTGTRNPP